MAGHQTPLEAYHLVAHQAREVLGFSPPTIEVGSIADLVAIDAPSIRAAIAEAPASRRVYRRGVLVASTNQEIHIHKLS